MCYSQNLNLTSLIQIFNFSTRCMLIYKASYYCFEWLNRAAKTYNFTLIKDTRLIILYSTLKFWLLKTFQWRSYKKCFRCLWCKCFALIAYLYGLLEDKIFILRFQEPLTFCSVRNQQLNNLEKISFLKLCLC